MKYRIKVTIYKNGRKIYEPHVKMFGCWLPLDIDGNIDVAFCLIDASYDKRETALLCIDRHFEGNTKKQKIEFEYINK